MALSFDLVNAKVAQANFFLGKLVRASDDAFEFHCYLTGFVTCCRSVTYVLQAVMTDIPGFAEWYTEQQKALQDNVITRYFNSVRRLDHHVGTIILGSRNETREYGLKKVKYAFARDRSDPMPSPPEMDVLSACHQYYDEMAQVVADCCVEFKIPVDPKVHYTQLNFDSLGESLSAAMQEVLGHPDAFFEELHGIENQWLILRELVWSTELLKRFEGLREHSA